MGDGLRVFGTAGPEPGRSLSCYLPHAAHADGEGRIKPEFLWGALGDALGPVQLGVELRPSHLRTSFAGFTDSRNILMTADVIGAVQHGGVTVYGQVGRDPVNDEVKSYEHWVGYQAKNGIGVRAGRFFPAYGVRFADHTSFNREYLGFDKYDQVYGVEVSRTTDKALVQVTLAPGLADSYGDGKTEHGFNAAGRVQFDLGPSTALVASGIFRDGTQIEPKNGSAGLAFGFAPTKRISNWTQGDIRHNTLDGSSFVFINETAFEATRGLWLKLSPQYRGEAGPQPQVMRWAVAAMLLPRTHFGVETSYYRDKPKGSDDAIHVWLLQFHAYL